MCGIAGFIDPNGLLADPSTVMQSMLDSIRHRGPDGSGVKLLGPAALGHRRLSIIDLEGGAQPMGDAKGRYWVTFNGEIYNYLELRRELEKDGVRFATQSDTEVLPYLYAKYGKEMPSRLRGMFALAIWDNARNELFLARDRVGIKPLFYRQCGQALVFSSELPSLLAHPQVDARVNSGAGAQYLLLDYVPEPETIIDGVKKLPAGHWGLFSEGRLEISPYWDLEALTTEPPAVSEDEALTQLDAQIRDAVSVRLMSDVPLGAFLSGGIDSGLVVSYMAELSAEPVKTFSIGFEHQEYNELPLARRVSEQYGTDHHEMIVKADAVDLLDTLVPAFGEPFGDSSSIPTYLVSRFAKQSVTVCLSGDGGDESFAGYTRYQRLAGVKRATLLPRWLRKPLAGFLGALDLEPARRGSRMFSRSLMSFAENYLHGMGAGQGLPLLPQGPREEAYKDVLALFGKFFRGEDPIRAAQYMDIKTYLVNDILTKVDRTSMAVSLEARVPLLDHQLLEWANSMPTSFKFRGGTGKWALKELAKNRLPAEHTTAKKRGFALPLREWFQNELAELPKDLLLAKDSHISSWVDMGEVERVIKRHLDGVEDHAHTLWNLVVLEKWCRLYL